MRAVVEGRLSAESDAFQTHIDRCLGCRACEPVCPSGVEYGSLLEVARDVAARHRPPAMLTRILLRVFATPLLRRALFLGGRLTRGSGAAGAAARFLPARGFLGSARLGLAMLAASAPWKGLRRGPATSGVGGEEPSPPRRGNVALLDGCVQDGLYRRVNEATRRVLEANGWRVTVVGGQDCCGALHAHGGDLEGARRLARVNVESFGGDDIEYVVVNAAGCGAAMKEYGHLLGGHGPLGDRAVVVAGKVRDINEILATVGPRRGAAVPCRVAVDHPCHLLHAQRIKQAPLDVLAAVPGVEIVEVENAAECCGGAGIYGMTHPELGGSIGGDKVAAVRAAGCDAVATANPGCMMQIGAGLRLKGAREGVVHPVEILDESYRRAGFYG
jgi:glycolate oxidase iron-sulfur subunit